MSLPALPDSNYRNDGFGRGGGGGGPSGGNSNFMPNNMGNNPTWGSGGGNSNNNNRNLDMPNLQSLGINPGGGNSQGNQGSNMNNPMGLLHLIWSTDPAFNHHPVSGLGLNLNPLSMNPAMVAAAINQWAGSAIGGMLNGIQNQGNNDQVNVAKRLLPLKCP